MLEIHLHRGRLDDAEAVLEPRLALADTAEMQTRAGVAGARAAVLFSSGRHADALAVGLEAVQLSAQLGYGQQGVKQGCVWAVEAALALGDQARAEDVLATIEALPPGIRPPFLEAQAHRLRARMSGDLAGFKAAAGGFREYDFPFWLAVAQLEHGEALVAEGRAAEAEPLLAEARETFERLAAVPWLERVDRVRPEAAVA